MCFVSGTKEKIASKCGQDQCCGHPDLCRVVRLPADGLFEVRISVCLWHSIDSEIAANESVPARPLDQLLHKWKADPPPPLTAF